MKRGPKQEVNTLQARTGDRRCRFSSERIPILIVDLTHPVISGMPVYPGDTIPFFTPLTEYDRDGYLAHELILGTHTGTHIDVPLHYLLDGQPVERRKVLDACVGTARVIDAIHAASSGEIIYKDIESQLDGIGRGDRLLFATGWSSRYDSPEFFTHFPNISVDIAVWCAEHEIALIGVDAPSLHRTDSDTVHRVFLSAGIVIAESLANLATIAGKTVFFSAAPLSLQGLDGSPVRAYAIV